MTTQTKTPKDADAKLTEKEARLTEIKQKIEKCEDSTREATAESVLFLEKSLAEGRRRLESARASGSEKWEDVTEWFEEHWDDVSKRAQKVWDRITH